MTKDKTSIEGITDKAEAVARFVGFSQDFIDGYNQARKELKDQVQAECEKYLDDFRQFMVSDETMEAINQNWNMPTMTIRQFFNKFTEFDKLKKEQREHE